MDDRPEAIFVADSRALDFLNSVATPLDQTVDWLNDGDGLLDWLAQAQLVPKSVIELIRSQALPGELDKVADQARTLREWFRAFVHRHKGKRLEPDDLAELQPLNRLLERDERYNSITWVEEEGRPALRLQLLRRWRSPDALLLPIGEALAQLVCAEDFSHVKACEGASCTLLFADHTRAHRRRWCSMAICGNRAKQSAHRQRFKAKAQPGDDRDCR